MVLDSVDNIGDDDLRFYEIIVGTEGFGAFLVTILAKGGEHNDLDVGGLGSVAEDIEDIKAADFRHHNVENN